MPITKAANSFANVKQITDADTASNAQAMARLSLMYDAIVGSSANVTEGTATHTSLQAAINSLPSGGSIYVLSLTLTENVNISNPSIKITGKGNLSVLNGNLVVSASYNDIEAILVTGNVSIVGNNNFLKAWISATSTFSDSGSANDYWISQE